MNFGRYQIVRPIAEGGMAEIFLARHQTPEGFKREVVVKRVLPHLAKRAAFIQAFLDEAKLSAQLSHPHIAQVFDLGRVGRQYFIAMEYVRGLDLARCLAEHRRAETPMPLEVVLRIVCDVCEALAYAHEASDFEGKPLSIVHRDVTPSNVIVGEDGHCKVLDFGIAKAASAGGDATTTGTIKGKYAYVAPEQLRNLPPDRRIDLWALGVVLFELSTGQHPFRADSPHATFERIAREDPRPPSSQRAELGSAFDGLIARALQKAPELRFQSAHEMLDALHAYARTVGCSLNHMVVRRYVREMMPHLVEPEVAMASDIAGETVGPDTIGLPSWRRWLTRALLASGVVAGIFAAVRLGNEPLRSAGQELPETTQTRTAVPDAASSPSSLPQQPVPAAPAAKAKRTAKLPVTANEVWVSGRLRVRADPWATIRIDGRTIGDTPVAPITLPPGAHTITFENPELRVTRVREVTIISGSTLDVHEDLLR
jgi:eukaryotic-like serine/threonine-protein kinase